jgi:lipopolysaccharide transport system ATP-binding protein
LKILSRVTAPTTGNVKVKGRIASLLEVGTGFHPELTGMENIFLNGAILGMTKAEIRSKLDEIIDFSGCERYIDTPVKRYSSGMMVRLGFAVAAHLEPEILIVDEVLAVGDAEFQKKCLGKMQDVAGHGRTVLFVSHNMTAVKALCPAAIRLEDGTLADSGEVGHVVESYLSRDSAAVLCLRWDRFEDAPGADSARIRRMEISYPGAADGALIYTNTPLTVTYEFWHAAENASVNVSTHLRDGMGGVVFNVWSHAAQFSEGILRGAMQIPPDLLNDGRYTLDFMIVHDGRPAFHLDPGLRFEVHDRRATGGWHGKVVGAIRPAFMTFELHHAEA